jgi:hypothetical protein
LLKKAEAARTEGANAGSGSHLERAIDAEVTRIANRNTADPDGLVTTDAVSDIPIDGSD